MLNAAQEFREHQMPFDVPHRGAERTWRTGLWNVNWVGKWWRGTTGIRLESWRLTWWRWTGTRW